MTDGVIESTIEQLVDWAVVLLMDGLIDRLNCSLIASPTAWNSSDPVGNFIKKQDMHDTVLNRINILENALK